MARLKKGVFISLGVLLLGLAVLSLSSVMRTSSYQVSDAADITAVNDRVGLITSSIGKGFRDTIDTSSGISISLNDNSVSFVERLPNSDSSHFESNMDDFKAFVEQDAHITLNVEEIKDHLPLTIMPQNITYYHPSYGTKDVDVIPGELNFDGYIIDVEAEDGITKCDFDTTAGTFNVTFYARTANGTECFQTFQIDPDQTNTFEVVVVGGGKTTMEISNGGVFDLTRSSQVTLNVTVLVNASSIVLPEDALALSFSDFGFSATRDVTILG
jgi:hypothetical protein